MIIAQISDTHIDPDDPEAASRLDDLSRCIADINRLDPLPDVVIHTGDIAHNGTLEKYRVVVELFQQLKPRLHLSAGNRDDRDALCEVFPENCTKAPGADHIQYAVDDFPVRLVAADTLGAAGNMGDYCGERAAVLDRILADDPDKPTVLFMHHPPFEIVESRYRWQFDSQEAIATLAAVLSRHPQVIRVFCGHAHRVAGGTVSNDISASCVPSVAVNLRLGDFPEAAETAPVYQLHHFRNGQAFETETRIAG